MDRTTARRTAGQTFKAALDARRYRGFINELCNGFDEPRKQTLQVPDAFATHVASCPRLGTNEPPDGELADAMVLNLRADSIPVLASGKLDLRACRKAAEAC